MVDGLIGLLVNRQLRASFTHLCSSVFICGSKLWQLVRTVSGDAAYEHYVATRNDAEPLLSPGEFYHRRMERKYSRPCRCC